MTRSRIFLIALLGVLALATLTLRSIANGVDYVVPPAGPFVFQPDAGVRVPDLSVRGVRAFNESFEGSWNILSAAGLALPGPIAVRITTRERCGAPASDVAAAVAADRAVCVFPGDPAFPTTSRGRGWLASRVLAELAQRRTGCGAAPAWVRAATAEGFAWTLGLPIGFGLDYLREEIARLPARPPAQVVLTDAVLRSRHADDGLVRFCRAVGRGTPWREAFATGYRRSVPAAA